MTADLIERLRREVPSGNWTTGSCCISSDGFISGTPSVPIMQLANPDGLEAAAEIERLRREMLAVQDRANANSDACKSCRAIDGMTRAALAPETDDGPCTDCDDTGWMYQTERQCTCGAKP